MEQAVLNARKRLEEQMRQSGATARMDLGDPEYKALLYHQLGMTGEKMRQKHPALYHAIENFQPVCRTKEAPDDYTDKYNLEAEQMDRAKNADDRDKVRGESDVQTIEEKQMLCVTLDLYNEEKDPGHEHPIYSDSDFNQNAQSLQSQFTSDSLMVDRQVPFRAIATYMNIRSDGSLEVPEARCVDLAVSGNSIVDGIEAYHPKRLHSSTPGRIIVCYNRAATPSENADYTYDDVVITANDISDQKISVHMPFAGSITLNQNFVFQQFLPQETEISIQVQGQSGQCSYKNKDVLEKVFKISDDKRTLSWNLKEDRPINASGAEENGYDYEDWGSTLLAERVSNNVTVDFYSKICFMVSAKAGGSPIPHHVIIKSQAYTANDSSSTKEIESICLWWGCMGKGTQMRMADGSWKRIEQIAAGDTVMLADGSKSEVSCVLSGEEEWVVHITTSGHELLASMEHPVMTRRGLIRAKDLNAGDMIAVEDDYEPLEGAYREAYNDKVYGLQLKESGNLIANGVVSGDFDAQQSLLPYETQPKKWSPYHASPVSDDLADLLAQKRPQNNSSFENMAAKPYYACRFEDETCSCAILRMKNSEAFQEYPFTLEFWMWIEGESREILSQESGFRMMVDGSSLIVMGDGKQTFSVIPGVELHHAWNQVFLIYDGESLTIGVNGFEVDTFETKCRFLDPACNLELGRHFTGYLRRVILYSDCLEASVLRRRMFQNVCSDDMEKLAFFLDGVTEELVDVGPNQFPVIRQASCGRVPVAAGFVPARGHGAAAPDDGAINPGGFASRHFSVYVKCYILPYSKEKSVLWSNGSFGGGDSVLLYYEQGDGNDASVKIECGGKVYDTSCRLATGSWQDLIVSYNAVSRQLSLYQNGRVTDDFFSVDPLDRASGGRFCIGNGWDGVENYPADALFTVAAVYDEPINEQRAMELYAAQPFVLSSGLVALFGFENGYCREYVSGQEVYTGEGERMLRSRITSYFLTADHYWYDIEVDTSGCSEEAKRAFRLYAAYMDAMFGICTDSLNDEYTDAVCFVMDKLLQRKPYLSRAVSGDTEDWTLCGVIREFNEEMDMLLNLTYANHPYNRRKSKIADKMGINSILASRRAIVGMGQYAVDYQVDELEGILTAMRDVLQDGGCAS